MLIKWTTSCLVTIVLCFGMSTIIIADDTAEARVAPPPGFEPPDWSIQNDECAGAAVVDNQRKPLKKQLKVSRVCIATVKAPKGLVTSRLTRVMRVYGTIERNGEIRDYQEILPILVEGPGIQPAIIPRAGEVMVDPSVVGFPELRKSLTLGTTKVTRDGKVAVRNCMMRIEQDWPRPFPRRPIPMTELASGMAVWPPLQRGRWLENCQTVNGTLFSTTEPLRAISYTRGGSDEGGTPEE